MKRIAIIPARGGSKRIPRKNIKDFFGKPVIAYAIELAIKSKLFDEVFVSTDCDEIRNISILYGASVPFLRSSKNASDSSTILSTIKEVLNNFDSKGYHFEYCCILFPISPLIHKEDLKKGFQLLIQSPGYDSLLSIGTYGHPIERSFQIDNVSNTISSNKNFHSVMTQDLPERYFDAGQFCWFDIKQILKKNSLITDNTRGMILNELQFQDVDNKIDWEILKIKFQNKKSYD
jgi:pseudaminic acid cytidylyltransferase